MNLALFIARRTARPSEENRPGVMVRIATLAVALSLLVMLLAMAVIMGFKREVSRKIVGFAADIELADIRTQGGLESHPIYQGDALRALFEGEPEVERVQSYVALGGVIKSPEGMQGSLIKGIGADYDTRFFEELLVAGRMPRIADSLRHKELLLSAGVASKLGLELEERVEVLFIDGSGTPRRDRYKLVGLYRSGMEEADNRYALTDARNLRRIMGWSEEQVSGFELSLHHTERAEEVSDRLNHELLYSEWNGAENLVARSVQGRYPAMFDWLRTHDVNAAVILGIMLVVALFNMTSVLLILVLERTRMIGMLKALGMANGQLRAIFLYRALFIILRGVVWGNVAALALALAQKWGHLIKLDASGYLLSEVPIAIEWGWWLAINLGAVAVILLLLAIPASIVGRIRPEQTIRYE